jgi:FAD binding domain-containing protein
LVTGGGQAEPVTASRGVILACGGFEADEYFKDAFLPVPYLHRVGHDGNTGDAIRMVLPVGGALWHMSEFFGWFAFQAAEYDAAFAIDYHAPGFLLVNAAGQRFADEAGYEVHERLRALVNVKPALGYYPALPAYGICDGRTLAAGALNGVVGTPNDYRWSTDNLAEVRRGWITRAGGPGELAEHLALDPAALTATLTQFNAAAAAGHDDRFGRAGGAGTVWGPFTHSGGGLTDALVFGRLAGQHAARSR